MPNLAVASKKPNGTASKIKPLSRKTLNDGQKEALGQLGKDKLVEMFSRMTMIREFERRCEQMYQQRKIGGFLHVYMGQEALAVGMLSAIHSEDNVTTC